MPITTIKLPNGTVITVDGSVEETARVMAIVSGGTAAKEESRTSVPRSAPETNGASGNAKEESQIDLVDVIRFAKTCAESNVIASKILDQRSVLNRVLLPLYLIHEYKENSHGLTSSQISLVVKELGVPIDVRNVSTCLSGPVRPYIIGDRVRVKGQSVEYKLVRRGVDYMKQVLSTPNVV